MTKIKKLVDSMEDELCSAKEYAECYVDNKVKGNSTWANRYKEMSLDELKHAMYLHEKSIQYIDLISKAVTPPVEMTDKWEHEHKLYVEEEAYIKMMLSL